jgi:hypothetical protein
MLIDLLQYRSITAAWVGHSAGLWVNPAGRQTAVYSSIVPWNAVGMQIRSGTAAPEPHSIFIWFLWKNGAAHVAQNLISTR